MVRQSFQFARCGCTLRVTPQTSYSPEYITPTHTKRKRLPVCLVCGCWTDHMCLCKHTTYPDKLARIAQSMYRFLQWSCMGTNYAWYFPDSSFVQVYTYTNAQVFHLYLKMIMHISCIMHHCSMHRCRSVYTRVYTNYRYASSILMADPSVRCQHVYTVQKQIIRWTIFPGPCRPICLFNWTFIIHDYENFKNCNTARSSKLDLLCQEWYKHEILPRVIPISMSIHQRVVTYPFTSLVIWLNFSPLVDIK